MKIFVFLFSILFYSCGGGEVKNEKPLTAREQKQQQLWQEIRKKKSLIKNGDLVTRAGTDAISASLRNFNKKDKSYSHSGIALIENGEIFVYHTLAGEENIDDKMLREPFRFILQPT